MKNDYYRVASALFSKASMNNWERYVRHVMPDLIPAAALAEMADDGMPKRVCGRANIGVLKLASAHINYITPRGQSWFKYDDDFGGTGDEKFWVNEVSQITQRELESSNFYPAYIAAVIDRIATGTGLMLSEGTKEGNLVFTHIPAGTYAVAEDKNHEVDTVVRKFKYTAWQAASAFGVEMLSSRMKDAYEDEVRRFKDEFEIWHLTLPRDVPAKGNKNLKPEEMSWASVYLDPQEQHVVSESGYYEFPYMATRWLKYGNSVYGKSALAPIVDTVEDSLMMLEAMKVAGQAAAFPRVLAMGSMIDEIDMRAGGVTVLRHEEIKSGLPREWAASGQYAVGKDLLELYNNEIDDALFVSVLQAVSQVERQMTALEANLRNNEKLMTFSQSFTQFIADLRPMMSRVFCILERLGKFPDEGRPDGIFVPLDDSGMTVKVLAPGTKYVSRMAKALESNSMNGLIESLGHAVQLASATGNPVWLDVFDEEKSMRFITGESNAPTDCLKKPKVTKAIREKREAAADQMQEMNLAKMQAASNRDNAGAVSEMQQ